MGDSEKESVQNVKISLALFKSLGFVVHPTKSVLIPSHKIIATLLPPDFCIKMGSDENHLFRV